MRFLSHWQAGSAADALEKLLLMFLFSLSLSSLNNLNGKLSKHWPPLPPPGADDAVWRYFLMHVTEE